VHDALGQAWVLAGILVEAFALSLIPLVVLRRKEPSSTAAWILALVFLPGAGALLFLMFGRDRLRLPMQKKRATERALAETTHAARGPLSADAREAALARLESPVERGLFRVGAALSGAEARPGNAATLLVDGDATYRALGDAIDAAEHHVFAEYYLVRRGATADWLRETLARAAKRGVEVKLLVDGYGSFWLGRRWLAPLREAGVEVAVFLPARLLLLQPMNLRNHRKIVVVDGDVAFTGGINVGDEYRGHERPWRDAHLALRGPAVEPLSRIFEQDWHFATGRTIAHKPHVGHAVPQEERGHAVVAVVRSGPDLDGAERETIYKLFFTAITSARERVHATTGYFLPDRAIVVALQTAALRGVDVRLLFPGRSNHPFVFQAGRSFYEELLESGVRIFEYGPGMIHAKTMVIDGSIALVGSANMDVRSFRLNFEVHAVVRDLAVAEELERIFEGDLALSREITLAEFRARSVAHKVVEGAARLLSPLM
jgi:cardiolipin synthase